jgi:hypothetical protein
VFAVNRPISSSTKGDAPAGGKTGWPSLRLCSCDALVLEYPHHDPSILSLALGRLVITYLPALAHSSWRQNVSERDVTLLLKKLCNAVRPVLA